MANLTVDVPWDSYISGEGKTELGNGANRFDAHRQSGTLSPSAPESPPSGPPETGGGAESAS